MRRIATFAAAASSGSTMNAGQGLLSATAMATGSGTKVAGDREKGHFLACHQMGDGISPGSIGPITGTIKARAPDRSSLYAQVWDAGRADPATRMPPFGKHEAVSNTKVDTVVGSTHPLISAGPCPA